MGSRSRSREGWFPWEPPRPFGPPLLTQEGNTLLPEVSSPNCQIATLKLLNLCRISGLEKVYLPCIEPHSKIRNDGS